MSSSKPGEPLQRKTEFLRPPNIREHFLKDAGDIPNNPKLPLLLYEHALALPEAGAPEAVEALLDNNQWAGSWRNGIYTYHHYHSTAHEVLVVYRGSASVQLGGEKGITVKINAGDVILIPAGVAHKNLGSSDDFKIIGAYPRGQDWNICYGKRGERPKADREIANVGLPKQDPIFGASGPLLKKWRH